jgi:DNA primase catalytic core
MATEDRLGGKKTLKVTGILEDIEKDEVKKRVDIIALFAAFGVSLQQKGKGYTGRCPWHEDSTPSLSVDREKGLYNCFGCGESGDAVTLVEKMKGLSFREALDYLKKESLGVTVTSAPRAKVAKEAAKQQKAEEQRESGPAPQATEEKQRPQAEPVSLPHPELNLATVADYYHQRLLTSPEALAYLKKRGFTAPELYRRFALGYADGSLLAKVTAGQQARLKELGIVNAGGYEHFKGSLTFPLYDEAGRIVGLYGRKLNDKAAYKHLYLPGGHKGLFNGKAASIYDELILTEAIIDGLALVSLGIENVIPLYGTNGLTEDHLAAFKEHRVKTLILALDNDEAGRKAGEKLKAELLRAGFNVKVCYPWGVKDWNEGLTSGFSREAVLSALKRSEVFMKQESGAATFQVEKHKGLYNFNFGETHYRVMGVKDCFVASLKVNILFRYQQKSHVDNPELYSARSRSAFALEVKRKTEVEESRVEKELLAIVEYLEGERDRLLNAERTCTHELTEEERKLGMDFLTEPRLFELIVEHMETLGYVGEELNKILVYLAASSRKLDDPISIVILSESAAGKSYLIDTVKKLLPEEDVISLTSLSDQALNYLPDEGLLHKFLVMGEAVHNEVVEHQLREMLSSKELSRLVTVKDERTGKMQSKLVRKEVIVSTVMSSTDYGMNPENLSRCFLINTDESSEQTKRIHQKQREKYSIERHKAKGERIPAIIRTHQAAQRLLKKRLIVNPLSKRLDFPAALIRSRRDHERFMDLIAAVCFLRQYQKEEKQTEEGLVYIECDREDYAIASRIMKSILPLTLTNFPKSALTLYETFRRLIGEKAKAEGLESLEVSLTQREVRELGGLSQMIVKRGLKVLCEYEYLREAGSSRNGFKKSYKLTKDLPIELVDLSQIVEPEALEEANEVELL